MHALEKLEARIQRAEMTLWLAGVVREQIRAMEGKPISKRLATAVEKRIKEQWPSKDWTVYWRLEYGMIHIDIWANNSACEFRNRFHSLIAHVDQNKRMNPATLSEADYVAKNQCYFLNADRLPLMRDALGLLDAWKERLDAMAVQKKALEDDMKAFGLSPSIFDGAED